MTAFAFVFGYRKLVLVLGVGGMLLVLGGALLAAEAPDGSLRDLWGDRLGIAGFAAVGAVFALYMLPGLIFEIVQSAFAPIGALRRIARLDDMATARLRSAAQGQVELQLDPVDDRTRQAFGLELPDYVGAFACDDDLIFILYPDVAGLPVAPAGRQFAGPVIASGRLRTIAVGEGLDIRHRPFALSFRIARKLFGEKQPEARLRDCQRACDRLFDRAAANGFERIGVLGGDPVTGQPAEIFAGGERQAKRSLRRSGLVRFVVFLFLALMLWFGFLRHFF